MREVSKISKWPFFVADAALWALGVFLVTHGAGQLSAGLIAAVVVCVVLGAVFGVWPFILDYRAASRLAETEALTSVVGQVQNMEIVAKRIAEATAQWQSVNEHAEKTGRMAKEMADRMAVEAKEFGEFMAQANETEKKTLKLETEKLRRSEQESLQVIVWMFDHIFALHAGAMRSGSPKLAEQVTQFVNACRDGARRIGLVPFLAAPGEKFDVQRHMVQDGNPVAHDAVIADTAAVGYTYQGKMLRQAVVQIRGAAPEPVTERPGELPLDEVTAK